MTNILLFFLIGVALTSAHVLYRKLMEMEDLLHFLHTNTKDRIDALMLKVGRPVSAQSPAERSLQAARGLPNQVVYPKGSSE